jgi:hypothetical protein
MECYRSNLWSSGSGNWRVVNNQNKISGVFIVFSRAERNDNFTKTMMIFDNMTLERINIKINGTQHPTIIIIRYSRIPPPPGGTAILPEYIHYYG